MNSWKHTNSMSRISRFVSSLTSRRRASSIRSPSSMCPPGTTHLPRHLCEFIRKSRPSALKISAPTVGSGYCCSAMLRPSCLRFAENPDHEGTRVRIKWSTGIIPVQVGRDESARFRQGLELVPEVQAEVEAHRQVDDGGPIIVPDLVELG